MADALMSKRPNFTDADVRAVPIASITIKHERRRKTLGNIAALQRSIETHGLIHPIVLRNGHELVAGMRRLEACKRLGWKTIPARAVETLSDEALRAIELAENTARLALDDYETSKQRLAEIRQAEARIKANELATESVKKSGRGRPTKPASRKAIAGETGLPASTQRDVEKHVALAEQYPFLQRAGWVQHSVLTAGHHLDQLPDAEREKVAALLDQDFIPPKKALVILENVAEMTPTDRKTIWRDAQSTDEHVRNAALVRAAALPPEPDPGLTQLANAKKALTDASKACRATAFKPRIEALAHDAAGLYQEFLAHHRGGNA